MLICRCGLYVNHKPCIVCRDERRFRIFAWLIAAVFLAGIVFLATGGF